jgi:hypothetical protein
MGCFTIRVLSSFCLKGLIEIKENLKYSVSYPKIKMHIVGIQSRDANYDALFDVDV